MNASRFFKPLEERHCETASIQNSLGSAGSILPQPGQLCVCYKQKQHLLLVPSLSRLTSLQLFGCDINLLLHFEHDLELKNMQAFKYQSHKLMPLRV